MSTITQPDPLPTTPQEGQTPLAAYSLKELMAVYEFIENTGGALGDTFTVNRDPRPLARFAQMISDVLYEMEGLVNTELVHRENPEKALSEPTASLLGSDLFPEAHYVFSYC